MQIQGKELSLPLLLGLGYGLWALSRKSLTPWVAGRRLIAQPIGNPRALAIAEERVHPCATGVDTVDLENEYYIQLIMGGRDVGAKLPMSTEYPARGPIQVPKWMGADPEIQVTSARSGEQMYIHEIGPFTIDEPEEETYPHETITLIDPRKN